MSHDTRSRGKTRDFHRIELQAGRSGRYYRSAAISRHRNCGNGNLKVGQLAIGGTNLTIVPSGLEGSRISKNAGGLIISRAELSGRLADRALVIVNVMPVESFKAGHIPGSVNLPIADIPSKARQVLSDLHQEITVYCAGPT